MNRIKELLHEWAGYHQDGFGQGFPKQSAFVSERVQSSNRSADTIREVPQIINDLNDQIEGNRAKGIKGLPEQFKKILRLEYLDRRPQKTKAAILGIPREVFSVRLRFIHELLNHAMYEV